MYALFSLLSTSTLVFFLLFLLIYLYYQYSFLYWKRRGVPYIESSFPFGSADFFVSNLNFGAITSDFYREFKRRGCKYGGIYAGPSPKLVLVDPQIIKQILTKDFHYFVSRGNYYNEKSDPLSAHLFNLEGKRWKNLRVKLTPTFTSGKMKMMFQTMVECSKNMEEALKKRAETEKSLDVKDTCACFTTDVIGTCAFGIECNCFKHPDAEFRVVGRKVFNPKFLVKLRRIIAIIAPEFSEFVGVGSQNKEASDFFHRVVYEVISNRENNNVRRNDLMQLLIDMKNNRRIDDMDDALYKENRYAISVEEIVAESFLFFVAGFDTSSSAMQFALYELARNPQMQERVRREINDVCEKHGGKITYEGVMEMKYLGQVIDESLRKYPSITTLTRKCEKDYVLPGTNFTVERGTHILIPSYGLHHDEEYFPDPEQFDPDRFSDENKAKIPPFTYLPFGEGPRMCIGLRFGLMQAKVGLCTFLRNFEFSVNPTMEPPEVDKKVFLMSTKKPIHLDFKVVGSS